MISNKDKDRIVELADNNATLTLRVSLNENAYWIVQIETEVRAGYYPNYPNLITLTDGNNSHVAYVDLNQVDDNDTRYEFTFSGSFLIEMTHKRSNNLIIQT